MFLKYITSYVKCKYQYTLSNIAIAVLFPKFYSVNKNCLWMHSPFLPLIPNFNTFNLSKSFHVNNNQFTKYDHSSPSLSHFKVQSLWENEENDNKPKSNERKRKVDKRTYLFKSVSIKQEELFQNKLEKNINSIHKITDKDWDDMKSDILEICGSINEENIDALILSKCSELQCLPIGKSFFKYLKTKGRKINLATYGNYLRLFYNCSSDCTDDDLNEINVVYEELLQVYPIIDIYTAEKAVCALCITKNWKEYEKLFKMMKMSYHPSSAVYSAVIKAAFKNKEFNLGWELMDEMQFQGIDVSDDVFIYWLEVVRNVKKDENFIRLLEFLNYFNRKPSLKLAETLKQMFEEYRFGRKGTFTTVLKRGECKNCYAKLELAHVSQEEYDELKTTFINPVLIGKDIFRKTQPEELSNFLSFLEKTAPYDIVLDGLNISMMVHKTKKSPTVFALQLKAVVRHFVNEDKKVLVLGRKHMEQWPSQDMQYVYNNAHVFFAEDISQDDPFLLYATLYSGLGTCFVSRDMMRGHKFLLANARLRVTFQKWQAQHQIFPRHIEENGIVYFQLPVSFMQNIQQNHQGNWHIPYVIKENLTTNTAVNNFHKHWLCLTDQSTQSKLSQYKKQMKPQHYGR